MDDRQKKISVVIPTYNRREMIPNLLSELQEQDLDHSEFQVIVVDDCSQSIVSEVVKPEDYTFELEIIRHETNRARGAACNTGIKAASGDIVVILDDDISIPKGLLRLHSEFHNDPANENSAAIGALVWGTGPEVTPGMYFLENSKTYFPLYPRVLHDNLPHLNTGNFSIRRDFLLQNGLFDEDFKAYGYEDFELGERLRTKGLRMPFLNGANVRHLKILDLDSIIKRQFALGKMMSLYYLKNLNCLSSINSLAPFRRLIHLKTEELDREVAILVGLEDLFKKNQKAFSETSEFHYYAAKLNNVLATYNSIGVVEGFKAIIPKFAEAFPMVLNSILLDEKDNSQAGLLEAAKALEILPNFFPLHFHMSTLLVKIGKTDDAVKLLELLKTQHPDVLHTYMKLAEIRSAAGDATSSMEICREIMARPGLNPLWRRRFAILLIEIMLNNNQTDAAFKEAMTFRDIYSTDPYLQYNVASLFEKKGILVTSRDLFKSVLNYLDGLEDCFEFRKLRSGIHYHLGTIGLSEERQKDALLDFSWSVRYNVAHKDAASKMLELRKDLGLDH